MRIATKNVLRPDNCSCAAESKTKSDTSVESPPIQQFLSAVGFTGKPDALGLEALLYKHKDKLDINWCGPLSGMRTALGWAASLGYTDIAAALLRLGADINKFGKDPRQRPLWQACFQGHVRMVRFLVSRGAKINERLTASGELTTALFAAGYNRHEHVVRALMEYGADGAFVKLAPNVLAERALKAKPIETKGTASGTCCVKCECTVLVPSATTACSKCSHRADQVSAPPCIVSIIHALMFCSMLVPLDLRCFVNGSP